MTLSLAGGTTCSRARASSPTLAHNWPYAGDPLFTDIILERGVDDAGQSTAIDVARTPRRSRWHTGSASSSATRRTTGASGRRTRRQAEFFSTDYYFDAGANDPQSPGDGYGTTVAMSGNGEVIVVGAPATNVYTFQAYLYAACKQLVPRRRALVGKPPDAHGPTTGTPRDRRRLARRFAEYRAHARH